MLYCIHEVALDAVEDDDGEEEGDAHEDGAVEKVAPVEGSTTHAAVLEGLENRGEGVEGDDVSVLAGGCAQRVDDGGGVHEELDAEANKLAQVTILGGHRRDDHAPRHGVESNEEHQEGEEDNGPIDMQVGTGVEIVDVDDDEQAQLDKHLDESGRDAGQGDNQTGEVDLTEDAGIGDEYVGGNGEARTEIAPQHDAGEIEQGLGGTIGGDAGKTAENEHIHDGGEDGLDDVPQRTEDGLLVKRDDVALDVHAVEVAVAPNAFNIYVEPLLLGLNFYGPLF